MILHGDEAANAATPLLEYAAFSIGFVLPEK